MKKKDITGWAGIIMLALFFLNCYLLNKLFFFIPESLGWVNEAIRMHDDSIFMPLRTFLCLTISLPLTLVEIGLYFRLNKKKRSRTKPPRGRV